MHQHTLASLETAIVSLRRMGPTYFYEVWLLETAQRNLMLADFDRDYQALLSLTLSKEITSQVVVSELNETSGQHLNLTT